MSQINTWERIVNHGMRKGQTRLILKASYEGSHEEGLPHAYVLIKHGKHSLKFPF